MRGIRSAGVDNKGGSLGVTPGAPPPPAARGYQTFFIQELNGGWYEKNSPMVYLQKDWYRIIWIQSSSVIINSKYFIPNHYPAAIGKYDTYVIS